mmetsp:Transcript_21754/g.50668  ORF Transcript_21754/g.50668 Transcript_21754/m.50668 type:complete len:104 (+) Transcript_21754:1748-2059(+)
MRCLARNRCRPSWRRWEIQSFQAGLTELARSMAMQPPEASMGMQATKVWLDAARDVWSMPGAALLDVLDEIEQQLEITRVPNSKPVARMRAIDAALNRTEPRL